MESRVRFVFNKRTGEVEEFTVEQETVLPGPEHELSHDRLAREVGSVVERTPRITELAPSQGLSVTSGQRRQTPDATTETDDDSIRERDR